MLGLQLDLMILTVFFNLNSSMISLPPSAPPPNPHAPKQRTSGNSKRFNQTAVTRNRTENLAGMIPFVIHPWLLQLSHIQNSPCSQKMTRRLHWGASKCSSTEPPLSSRHWGLGDRGEAANTQIISSGFPEHFFLLQRNASMCCECYRQKKTKTLCFLPACFPCPPHHSQLNPVNYF